MEKLIVVLTDRYGMTSRAALSPNRISDAGVIQHVDSFYVFQRIDGMVVHFAEVNLLILGDEEIL